MVRNPAAYPLNPVDHAHALRMALATLNKVQVVDNVVGDLTHAALQSLLTRAEYEAERQASQPSAKQLAKLPPLLPCAHCGTQPLYHATCFSHPAPTGNAKDCLLAYQSWSLNHAYLWNTRYA